MKKRYEEVMEKLTVTDEMKARILENVAEKMTDNSSAASESVSDAALPAKDRPETPPALSSEKKEPDMNTDEAVGKEKSDNPISAERKKTARIYHFHALQGVLAAAACAALVLLMRGLLTQRRPADSDQVSVMSGTTAAAEETAPAAENSEQEAVPFAENETADTAEAAGRSAAFPKDQQAAAAKEASASIANGMEEVSSEEALSEAVGFAVPDIGKDLSEVLSFTSAETVYTSYWGEMAQITYRGTASGESRNAASDSGMTAGQSLTGVAASDSAASGTAAKRDSSVDALTDSETSEAAAEEFCFRVSEGTEDNSGDYNTYADVRTVTVGKIRVTLKGDEEDAAVLAIWSSGGYSYSLSASRSLTDSEWEALITRISSN